MKRIFLFVLMIITANLVVKAELIPYKAPIGSPLNRDFDVKVREKGKQWHTLPTYLAQVANVFNAVATAENTSFSYFDFSGEVEVSVTYKKGTIKQAKVRPLSFGINHKVARNTITFFLTKPSNLSVEVNGDIFHNLQLFANPIETFRPSLSDPNVIYYGPGIHDAGTVIVPSNKTVYISGGAVVKGRFIVTKAENVRIMGRGILTQMPIDTNLAGIKINPVPVNIPASTSPVRRSRNDILTVEFSKNVEVNGIVVMPHKYSILIGESTAVRLKNFKSFSWEGNSDGIDVFCSSDVHIDGIFMRNADDCIAIYAHRWDYFGDTKDITIKNAVLWADVAHPILIGTHGDTANPDTISNIQFDNIDILDQFENQIDYQGCLSLNAGDSNFIRDISFKDVHIEDIRKGQLINMRVMYNKKYNTSAGSGIENIHFKNIVYNGQNANMSVISGYDETRGIKNVTFENLTINGKIIADDMPHKPKFYKTGDMSNFFIGEHVQGLKFIKSAEAILK